MILSLSCFVTLSYSKIDVEFWRKVKQIFSEIKPACFFWLASNHIA